MSVVSAPLSSRASLSGEVATIAGAGATIAVVVVAVVVVAGSFFSLPQRQRQPQAFFSLSSSLALSSLLAVGISEEPRSGVTAWGRLHCSSRSVSEEKHGLVSNDRGGESRERVCSVKHKYAAECIES